MALYRTGHFREALRELQAYRRITGRADQNHLIADSHRALGSPERAVSAAREAVRSRIPQEARAEAAVVGAAALADLGRRVLLIDADPSGNATLGLFPAGAPAAGLADLLLGAANPSGRLAETLPLRLQDSPSYLNFPGEAGSVHYGEGVFVGYRGYDALDRDVSYPFGHGLSYTTFDYADLHVAVSGDVASKSPSVEVSCRVTNTGSRRGKEVVQLYVGDPVASVARPPRELRGFSKVDLAPGATETVTFRLSARDLSYWSSTASAWLLEPGEFTLAIGRSSRDLRAEATIEISAPRLRPALDHMTTLEEWLAHPVGSTMLLEAVGTDDAGRPRGILGSEEMLAVIGNFPIGRLAAFPGLGFDRDVVDDLVKRAARSPRG
jgi:beta-glucosidase